jgi:hypothetical protein
MKERPISTLIFGILNIGLGSLKLIWPLVAAALAHLKSSSQSSMTLLQNDPTLAALSKFNTWMGVAMGLAMLAFGIGLLLLQNWARIGSIVYAVIAIVLVLGGSIVAWPITERLVGQMAAQQAAGTPAGLVQGLTMLFFVLGILVGLAYPVLLLFFMTRASVIEACQRQEPVASA